MKKSKKFLAGITALLICIATESFTGTIFNEVSASTYESVITADTDSNLAEYKKQVAELVNNERAKENLPALTYSDTLNNPSDIRATELIELFEHERPDGTMCNTILGEYGIVTLSHGENIARTPANETNPPEDVVDLWMNSSGHRANILDSDYTNIGIGVVYYGGYYYWIQTFTNDFTIADDVKWKLDGEGTLTVSGTGDMPRTLSLFSERNKVKKIVVGDEVKSLNCYELSRCKNLEEITILNPDCEIKDDLYETTAGTIYGYVGSTAQNYAQKYNKSFIDISTVPTTTTPTTTTSTTTVSASTGTCGENLTWVLDDEGTLTISGTGDMEDYSWGESPWHECENVKKIIIEDSVTNIGSNAFNGCSNLTSVTIPDSVTSIGEIAFYGCESLTEISLPDSIINIGESAFQFCLGLKSINIPNSVKSIGGGSFYSCNSLNEIKIPESVTNIGVDAFFGTPWLSAKCSENPFVIVNNILISAGTNYFGDIVIPDGVTSICGYAFRDRMDLTSVIIPDSVTSIGDNAFLCCEKLTSITILNPDCKIYDSVNTIYNTATIYGYENSTAQAYAEKYERNFVSLGEAPTTTDSKITGDANEDGAVNMSDAVLIMQSISNPSEYQLTEQGTENADVVDGDGVTNKDALAIQMIEAKLLKVEDFPITSADMENLM